VYDSNEKDGEANRRNFAAGFRGAKALPQKKRVKRIKLKSENTE